MSHPEDDARFLHNLLDLKAVFDRRSERLLAQNVISLCSTFADARRWLYDTSSSDSARGLFLSATVPVCSRL